MTVLARVEVTNLFGGEARYCWVRRYAFSVPDGMSARAIVRKAKQMAGLTGLRTRTSQWGGGLRLDVVDQSVVCFINFTTP